MTDSRHPQTHRRTRRRKSRAPLVLLAVVVCLVAAGAAYAWSRTQVRTSATQGGARGTAVAPHVAAQAPAPSAAVTVAPPVSATATPQNPADKKAIAASADAVAKAAVDFPGAPSIKPRSINHLNPKHKYVAITLDDGYGFRTETLDLLEQYDARCTTFLLGGWASSNKAILKRLHKDGFEIANHTWDHKTLTKLSDAQIASELKRTQKVISSVTGNQAPYMRPPGGATNSRVKAVAADLGYTVVMWDRTFADSSKHASAKNSYHYVMEYGGGVKPGDIILCHWGSKNTYEAMKRILPELKAQGYEFVTISELIADSPPPKKSSK